MAKKINGVNNEHMISVSDTNVVTNAKKQMYLLKHFRVLYGNAYAVVKATQQLNRAILEMSELCNP